MRSFKQFTVDIVKKPPLSFPLIGLFHVLLLLWTVWNDHNEPFGIVWLEVAWMIGYVLFWIAACDMRKWGAWGYFLLTLLDLSLYMAYRNNETHFYYSNMHFLDGLFSVILLAYYKKFR